MANNINIVHEMINKVGFEFDDATAKKVTQLAEKAGKMAASGMTSEASVGLAKISEIFNKELAKLGKQKIDFSKMIASPDSGTFESMLNTFVSQVSGGLIKGLNAGMSDIEKQFGTLMTKRTQAIQKRNDLESQYRIKTEEASRLDKAYEGLISNRKVADASSADFVPYAQEALANFSVINDELSEMEEKGKVNASTLLKWLSAAKELSTVYNTISKMSRLEQDQITPKIGSVNMKYLMGGQYEGDIGFGSMLVEEFTDTDGIEDALSVAKKKVVDLNTEIAKLTQQHPELIDKQSAIEAEERLNRVQEAYERLFYKSGKNKGTINDRSLKEIESTLSYTGIGSKISELTDDMSSTQVAQRSKQQTKALETLDKLGNEYVNSAGSSWEKRSQSLLRFIKEYESQMNNRNMSQEMVQGWADMYKELKPMASEAETMLRNVINMAKGEELTDMSKIGAATKDVAASAEQKRVADEASAEANEKARVEAEAKAKADKEVAAAAEKERLAQEEAARAAREKADARRSELTGQLSGLGADATDANTLASNLAKRREIFGLLQQEDLLTDEIRASYDAVNAEIVEKISLLQQANTNNSVENQTLQERIALLKQISNAYTKQVDAEDAYNDADTPRQEEKAEAKLEAANEAVQDFESQYHSAMVTMQDGSKINIPLDEEFAETTQKILADASKIKNIDLVPRSADGAIQAYESIGRIITNVNKAWPNQERFGNFRGMKEIDTYKGYLQNAISKIQQGDPDNKYGSKDSYNQAVQMLEKLNTLSQHINIRDAFTEQLNSLGLEWDNKINGPYETVLKSIRSGTFTTVDQCVAKFKELANIKDTVVTGTGTGTGLSGTGTGTGKAPTSDKTTVPSGTIIAEATELEAVRSKVAEVTAAVNTKNKAFYNESQIVGQAVGKENAALISLKGNIESITNAISAKTQAFLTEQNVVRRVAQSEVSALNTVRTSATAFRTELSNINTLLSNINTRQVSIQIPNLGGITSQGNVANEVLELENLRRKVDEVTSAVKTKTASFIQEEIAVRQSVAKEISTLIQLERILTNINTNIRNVIQGIQTNLGNMNGVNLNVNATVDLTAIETTLNNILTAIPNAGTGARNNNAGGQGGGRGQGGGNQRGVAQHRIDKLESELEKYRSGLDAIGNLTQSYNAELDRLLAELGNLQTSADVTRWQDEFSQFKNIVGMYDNDDKRAVNRMEQTTQKDILSNYKEIGKLLAKRETATSQEEIDSINNQIKAWAALAQEKQHNVDVDKSLRRSAVETARREALITNEVRAEQQDFRERIRNAKREAGLSKSESAESRAVETFAQASALPGITPEVQNSLNIYESKIKSLHSSIASFPKDGIASDAQKNQLINQRLEVDRYTKEIQELIAQHERLNGQNAINTGINMSSVLGTNHDNIETELTKQVQTITKGNAHIKSYNAETQQLIYTMKAAGGGTTQFTAEINKLNGQLTLVRGTTTRVLGVFELIGKKVKEYSTYFTGSMMVMRLISEIKQGISIVKEIDSALTELKKVTDETEESYDRFLDTASKTAGKVGSTVKDIVSSTADWARLGYSLEEAAGLAESTSVLLNVSEFSNIDEATSALTSTLQAFSYTADQSMDVVDVMNEVGNNFAVSSDGIATALQDSASALMMANNSYEQAVALIAAANRVVQDPNSVGSALRTISLRLRGTSAEELSELGEDTSGTIESTSKLQSKIKGLSGVDILTDSGAYKDTYTILLEISKVWEKMSDIDQAALLEIIAGKNRANTAAAILSNTKDLEEAYKSAIGAEGSAWEENEKYLNSIQGRIDLFNNSLQTMWNNELNSNWIKGFVNFGKVLVEIIDFLGLIPSSLIAISLVIMKINKMNLIEYFGSVSQSILKINAKLQGYVAGLRGVSTASQALTSQMIQQQVATNAITQMEAIRQATTNGLVLSEVALTEAEAAQLMTAAGLSDVESHAIANKLGLSTATQTLTLATLQQAMADGTLTASEATRLGLATGLITASTSLTAAKAAEILASQGVAQAEAQEIITKLGLSGTTKTLTAATIQQAIANGTLSPTLGAVAMGLFGVDTASKSAAGGLAALWAALWPMLAVMGAIAVLWGVVKLFDAVHVSAKEASEQLKETKDNVSALESELESLQTQLDETRDKIAELTALPSLSLTQQEDLDRLEREVELLERQIALKERQLAIEEKKLIKDTENAIESSYYGDNVDKKYSITSDGVIQEDKWNTRGRSGEDVVKEAIKKYEQNKKGLDVALDLASGYDTMSDYEKYVASEHVRNAGIVTNYEKDIVDEATFNANRDDYTFMAEDKIADWVDHYEEKTTNIAKSIEDFFNDPDYAGIEYGMSGYLDTFKRDFDNLRLEWEQALYGDSSKVDAIESLWGPDATDEMKNFKSEIDKIMAEDGDWASDDEKWQSKNEAIKSYIDSINATADGYKQLDFVMNTVGASAQDIADYFTVLNGEFNSNTIEGITKQYADALNTMNQIKNMSTDGSFTIGTENYNWEDFFSKNDEGKFEARADKFAEILKGMDKEARETFTSLMESVKNGELSWDQALKSFEASGNLAGLKVIEAQIIELNNVEFKNISDEISGVIDTFGELSAALDDVASSMELLNTAQTQMNNAGRISVKTALEIMQSTDQWNEILQIENGNIQLVGNATEILVEDKIALIKANLQNALATVTEQLAMIDSQNASEDLATTMEESTNQAVRKLAGSMAYLTTMMEAYTRAANGEFIDVNSYMSKASDAQSKVESELNWKLNSAKKIGKGDLERRKAEIEAQLGMLDGIDTASEFKNNYDFDKTPGDKYKDSGSDKDDDNRLENIQKKYEGKIQELENQMTYIENENERLEEIGMSASRQSYEELIAREDKKIALYKEERDELEQLLTAYDPASEEYAEVANAIWEMNHAIQESTINMVKNRKAIIDLYSDAFDKVGEAYDNENDIYDDQLTSMQGYAELLELRGETASKGLYDQMIGTVENRIANNWEKFNEQDKFVKEMGIYKDTLEEGSDEWIYVNQAIIEARDGMRDLKNEIQDDEKQVEQLKEEFKDLAITIWDEVRAAYDLKDQFFTKQQDSAQSYIDRLGVLNINVPDDTLKEMADIQAVRSENFWKDYQQANAELENLKEQLDDPTDPRYVEKALEVADLYDKYYDSETERMEFEKQILDNRFDRFNQLIDRVNNTVSTLQKVSDLLGKEDVSTEDGEWTAEGLTRLGVAHQQMAYSKEALEEISEEMETYERLLDEGKISEKEYTEKMQELSDKQWEAIDAYENQKDAIIELEEARIDMIEEGLDKEIEAYQELIDLKKEELDAERDLYDFKKNIEKQSKDIAALERRIASMSGSTDASTITERTKLQAELREAQESLDGSYRDHAYNSMSDALDDEMEEYSKTSENYIKSLRESIKETDLLIETTFNKVIQNGTIVLETLVTESNKYGVVLDGYLTSPWENATIDATTFRDTANSHFQEVFNKVNDNSPTMSYNLSKPYKDQTDGDGATLPQYRKHVSDTIDGIIQDNIGKQLQLKTSLDVGFKLAKSSVDTFKTDATSAVEAVEKAFIGDPEKGTTGLLGAINEISNAITNVPDLDVNYTKPNTGGDSGDTTKTGGYVEKPASVVSGYDNGGLSVSQIKQMQTYLGFGDNPDGKWGKNSQAEAKNQWGITAANEAWSRYSSTHNQWKSYSDASKAGYSNIRTSAEFNRGGNDKTKYKTYQRYLDAMYHKYKLNGYAKGTMGTTHDQWAITDESWIGEEITLAAGKNGQLQYLKKGSAVMPADISANLVEWGKLNPNMMGVGSMMDGINLMSNYINKPEIKLDVENFLKVDRVDRDTLPELEKIMDKKIDTFAKQLNASIRKYK